MNETTSKITSAGDTLLDFCIEVILTGFHVRENGKASGAAAPWGGGLSGVLNNLKAEGPQTAWSNLSAIRRSKLVRLTPASEARLWEMMLELRRMTEELADGMDAADLRIAVDVLIQIR